MERARRLHRGTQFDQAFREGVAVNHRLLFIRHRPNGLDCTRWGFAVGKRLAKGAVVRNRVRRRLREAARSLPVAPGRDIIVGARGPALEAGFGELRTALTSTLARAGLLSESEA